MGRGRDITGRRRRRAANRIDRVPQGVSTAASNLPGVGATTAGDASTVNAPSAFGAIYGPLTSELAGLVGGEALGYGGPPEITRSEVAGQDALTQLLTTPTDFGSTLDRLYHETLPLQELEERRISEDVAQNAALGGVGPESGAVQQLRNRALEPLRSSFRSGLAHEAIGTEQNALNRLLSATGLAGQLGGQQFAEGLAGAQFGQGSLGLLAALDQAANQERLANLGTAGNLLSGLFTPSIVQPQVVGNTYLPSPGSQVLGSAGDILGGKRQNAATIGSQPQGGGKRQTRPIHSTPPILPSPIASGGFGTSVLPSDQWLL